MAESPIIPQILIKKPTPHKAHEEAWALLFSLDFQLFIDYYPTTPYNSKKSLLLLFVISHAKGLKHQN